MDGNTCVTSWWCLCSNWQLYAVIHPPHTLIKAPGYCRTGDPLNQDEKAISSFFDPIKAFYLVTKSVKLCSHQAFTLFIQLVFCCFLCLAPQTYKEFRRYELIGFYLCIKKIYLVQIPEFSAPLVRKNDACVKLRRSGVLKLMHWDNKSQISASFPFPRTLLDVLQDCSDWLNIVNILSSPAAFDSPSWVRVVLISVSRFLPWDWQSKTSQM